MRALLAAGLLTGLALAWFPGVARSDETPVPLERGVRGLITRASGKVVIDGKLDEWAQAFCTPVQYNHKDLSNRAGQFFYLWDDEAFYIGLRCLDQKQANEAPI